MTFDDFFTRATGNPEPYPYQRRFATRDAMPQVLSVPTGVGKTATVVLGWLWRRRYAADGVQQQTPRRMVYCLPMRTLVEQTRNECERWLDALDESGHVGVHILMGGEDSDDWDAHPERDAIIIGTQDMLLSRALNRGYGMSRYRWPMHFGLLNNDCLWVLDETQLMGVGLTTSCQLAGLREKLHTYGVCQTLWMSATLDNDALQTVDHARPDPEACGLSLNDDDRVNNRVSCLLTAAKPLASASVQLDPNNSKKGYEQALAAEVADKHRPKTLTLVVVNNVGRAQKLFTELQKALPDYADDIKLIHSRFRAYDRGQTQAEALNESTIKGNEFGRIVVATQAIEAGVDISATTLFTELAPWSSLVQRFGRCNRRGICGTGAEPRANVLWIDFDTSDAKKAKSLCLPYEADSLKAARDTLSQLSDAGPQSLDGVSVDEPQPIVHVLRRKDLVDLFDTTPDLSGNDLDVSRYIRDSEDNDVQVYWRDWDLSESKVPPDDLVGPQRDELCSVSIGQAKTFVDKLKKTVAAAIWDPLSKEWRTIGKSDVRPGLTILLHASVGGYRSDLGWTADVKHKPVAPVGKGVGEAQESMGSDDTRGGQDKPLELTQHLRDVAHHAESLREQTGFDDLPWDSIITAARWHDVGKVHEACQTAMRDSKQIADDDKRVWAKSGEKGLPRYRVPITIEQIEPGESSVGQAVPDADAFAATDEEPTVAVEIATDTKPPDERRPGFRHELASALAWLEHNKYANRADVNLIAYLIAAHHGKVRLSIRSMPNERQPRDTTLRFARGIHEGDALAAVDLGNGETTTAVDSIKLDLMSLGESESGPSWLARMLEQRKSYGPFRLAFLETLVRLADWRGSANPGCGGAP